MSTTARRAAAYALGRCSSCLTRPSRAGRSRCGTCLDLARERRHRLKLKPITVREVVHASLCAISRRLGVTLGEAVEIVLAQVGART